MKAILVGQRKDLDKQDKLTFDEEPKENSQNPVTSGGVYKKTQWMCNPNLLDNWYFVNPVNQRGQQEYIGNVYTIDRWATWNATTTVKLTETGLATSDTDTEVWIYQVLDDAAKAPGHYTISVLFSTGGTIQSYSEGKGSIVMKHGEGLVSESFDFTSETAKNHCRIGIHPDNDSIIIAAKLELGSAQTLAHKEGNTWILNEIPNFSQELLKCQRYQYSVFRTDGTQGYIGPFYSNGESDMFGLVETPVTMRARPTIIYDKIKLTHWNPEKYTVGQDISKIEVYGLSNSAIQLQVCMQGTVPVGDAGFIYSNNPGPDVMILDANL